MRWHSVYKWDTWQHIVCHHSRLWRPSLQRRRWQHPHGCLHGGPVGVRGHAVLQVNPPPRPPFLRPPCLAVPRLRLHLCASRPPFYLRPRPRLHFRAPRRALPRPICAPALTLSTCRFTYPRAPHNTHAHTPAVAGQCGARWHRQPQPLRRQERRPAPGWISSQSGRALHDCDASPTPKITVLAFK